MSKEGDIAKLDQIMQVNYNRTKNRIVDVYPYLVAEGDSVFRLYLSENNVRTFNQLNDIKSYFDFGKTIAHIIVLLNVAVLDPNWKKILTAGKNKMVEVLKLLPTKLKEFDRLYHKVSYNKVKIPFNRTPEQIIIEASHILHAAIKFIDKILTKNSYTIEDYENFSKKNASFYVDFAYNIFYTVEGRSFLVLYKWKNTVLKKKWNDLFIVDSTGTVAGENLGANIRGSFHYSTIALHVKELMTREHYMKNIISVPKIDRC